MQAAVLSVLLMAGVFGAPPSQCGCDDSQGVVQQDNHLADGAQHNKTLWSPVRSDGTLSYEWGALGWPRYSPLRIIHGKATFYPANYTKPYDYREAFGYPWNGPRPLAPPAMAPTPMEAAPEGAWPAATAASYLRQSTPRVASKPAIATP